MIDPIYILFLGLTFLNLFISSLRILHFIQLKEYRFDRFKTLIRYEGGLAKLNTVLGYLSYFLAIYALVINNLLLFGVSLLLALSNNLWILATKGLYRFKPTVKALALYFTHFVLLILFFLQSLTITRLNIIFLASSVLLVTLTLLLAPITRLFKNIRISQAQKKLYMYTDLKVIGITGSYGKSSTKEFLYQILDQHTKVIKTPKNINTDIGVANFILQTDFQDAKVFIVEMGAYQKGEIAKISKMVSPHISIITAVHNQHLSLYGSHENIAKAKFEIVENTRPDGIFLYCMDSPSIKYIQQFLQKFPIQNQSITATSDASSTNHIKDLRQTNDGHLKFALNDQQYSAPIIGKHFATNLGLCVLACQQLGLDDQQIKTYLTKTFLPENTFSIKKGVNSSIILDDSYNSSPAGFKAAISTAETYTKNFKILVTMGMLELGRDEAQEHQKIAIQANKVFDIIVVTSLKTYKYFQDYIPDSKLKYIGDPKNIVKFIQKNLKNQSIVLLENRVPASLKNYLFKES